MADNLAMSGLPMAFGKVKNNPHAKKAIAPIREASQSSDDDDQGIDGPSSSKVHPQITAQPAFVEPEYPGDDEDDQVRANIAAHLARTVPASDIAAEDEEEYDEASTQEVEDAKFPIAEMATLTDHHKAISALAIDPSGARIASGSFDYDVKLWDFGGMNRSFKPFKTFEPVEAHTIKDIAYSPTGDTFVVITGEPEARMYTRDGEAKGEFVKGDMYLRDMHHTGGHVSEIYACAWDPSKAGFFMTCSADSTIRIWDSSHRFKSSAVIVVKSKERGTRTKVTACAYSPDGKFIAAGCRDGALHLYSTLGNYARPNATVEGAHARDSFISGIAFSNDGQMIVTRGCDGKVKIWDKKKIKKPVAVYDLACTHEQTNVLFSPDGKYILTGCSELMADGRGFIAVLQLNGNKLEEVRKIPIDKSAVIKVLWHSRINQIVTGSASGAVHVMYSRSASIRGALLCVGKAVRKRGIEDLMQTTDVGVVIQTPHALPMFQEDDLANQKRKRGKEISDQSKLRKPEPPINGPGRGGRVGSSATQFVVEGLMGKEGVNSLAMDPREALLKYATEEEKNSVWSEKWGMMVPKGSEKDVKK